MNLFYILVLGIPIFASLCTTQCGSKNRKKIHRLVTFVLAILLALRNNIGADFFTYKAHYEVYLNGNVPNVKFDIGYEFINNLLGSLGIPYSMFLFIIGAFILHSFYRYLEDLEIKHEFIPTAFYFLIFDIFIYSLSAIRQSIAIGCLFFTFIYEKHKKIKRAVVVFILGCLFHWSLLFMVPCLILSKKIKCVKFSSLIILIPISSVLYYMFMKSPLLEKFAGINDNLNFYLMIEKTDISYGEFTYLIYALLVFLWVFVVVHFKKLESGLIQFKKLKNYSYAISLEEWFVYIFLLSKIWLVIQYNASLPRIQMYWYFMVPFFMGIVAEKIKGNTKFLLYSITFMLLLISFISKLTVNYRYYGDASILL